MTARHGAQVLLPSHAPLPVTRCAQRTVQHGRQCRYSRSVHTGNASYLKQVGKHFRFTHPSRLLGKAATQQQERDRASIPPEIPSLPLLPSEYGGLAPKPSLDIKHIRTHADDHNANCRARNYMPFAQCSYAIRDLHAEWAQLDSQLKEHRSAANALQAQLNKLMKWKRVTDARKAKAAAIERNVNDPDKPLHIPRQLRTRRELRREKWLERFSEDKVAEEKIAEDKMTEEEEEELLYDDAEYARKTEDLIKDISEVRAETKGAEQEQRELVSSMTRLALALPNLTSPLSPVGNEPKVIETTLENPPSNYEEPDHVSIAQHLRLLDFAKASSTTGAGFYFLMNDGERLETALVQYAKSVARSAGFTACAPPSMVYEHILAGCGFSPRDDLSEPQQIYRIEPHKADSAGEEQSQSPRRALAATAEIPFAGMLADQTLEADQLPRRLVGSSRCFRAEAGGRGQESRGLFRVHEFTKVEMFAWTMSGDEDAIFKEMLEIQKQIMRGLNLPYRQIEVPTQDLGAAAYRKHDLETWFPSRRMLFGGWGEVTSTSICTDYQTRRLNTRVRLPKDHVHPNPEAEAAPTIPVDASSTTTTPKTAFPSTVNGTALAVPRIIAAILENRWDSVERRVNLPEVLWPFMDGQRCIGPRTPR